MQQGRLTPRTYRGRAMAIVRPTGKVGTSRLKVEADNDLKPEEI
jgi:hypothetical protein